VPYGTAVTRSHLAAVSVPAPPWQLFLPLPLSMPSPSAKLSPCRSSDRAARPARPDAGDL